jgi:hypothetical protein
MRLFSRAVKRVLGSAGVAGTALALVISGLQPVPAAQAAVSHPARPTASPAPTVASEPDALAAMQAARRQHSRVEIASERTAYAQTFANPDGTTTFAESPVPRWVRHGSSWATADASLVRGSDGSWSPKAAENGLSLSGGGDRVLATVRSGGQWL